jgi:hypothetical protein
MQIKIFNNDPTAYIFPVFTTGGKQTGGSTEVQAWFCKDALSTYATNTNFRFYYNPGNPFGSAGSGIAPGGKVTLQIPLYTDITTDRLGPYIDWWTGGQMELFFGTANGAPQAYKDLINGKDPNNKMQAPLSFSSKATIPDCVPTCSSLLQFFTDPASIAKANPSQLLEFNLGARQTLAPCVNSQPPNPAGPNTFNPACLQPRPTNVPNALDTRNVDVDMSYVNVAFAPATMAPFQNDQTGYVGTPQSAQTFSSALSDFISQGQCQPSNQKVTSCVGWPQLVHTNPDGTKDVTSFTKLASPLDIFLRNSPPTPHNPPDLCGFNTVVAPEVATPACPNTTGGLQWPNSSNGNVAKLWPPIQVLLDNWISHAGSLKDFADGKTPAGSCGTSPAAGTFCAAIMDVKTLIIRNYINYANLCRGAIPLNDFTAIAHVYGWTPFNENCAVGATGNLLQNTPIPGGGSYADNNFALYQQVKLEFDQLNNNVLTDSTNPYNFNPWVNVLIHGPNFVNKNNIAPNVYAYSVDDAVGNLQSEGGGFIIDVGSSQNLCSGTTPCPNQNPAGPPVNVTLSLNFMKSTNINFTNYGLCQFVPGDPNSDKKINTLASSFVLNPNAPQQCPIFLVDNQNPPQLYTFTISKAPNQTQPPEFVPCQGGTPNCKPTAANTCINGGGPNNNPFTPPCAGGVVAEGTTQVINCRDQIQKSNGRTCIGASPACDATNSVPGNTPLTTIPTGGGVGSATFQTSSQTWCCVKNAPLNGVPQVNGVWAHSQPNPAGDSRGKGSGWEHFVGTNLPQAPSGPVSCSMGQ